MTATEIKKGIECCQTQYERNCKECPYDKYKKHYITVDTCSSRLRKDVLELFNRQQAEIDKFTTAYPKTFESIKKIYATAKSEAYKEFAERLKEDLLYCEVIVGENGKFGYPSEDINECIDNTAKEMGCGE